MAEKRIKAKDRIGTIIGNIKILDVKRENKRTYAKIICPFCQKEKWTRLDHVIQGQTVSCGCYNAEANLKKMKDLTGQKIGRLTVKRATEHRDKNNGAVIWECECKCGNVVFVSATNLNRKSTRSCGCLGRENSTKNAGKAAEYVKKNFCIDGTNPLQLKKKTKLGVSGIKGVTWDKDRNKWCAQIWFKGKNYHLGRFGRLEDAAKARQEAEEQMFDNFLEWYAETYPDMYKKINNKKMIDNK